MDYGARHLRCDVPYIPQHGACISQNASRRVSHLVHQMELAPTPELRHDRPVTPMTPPTGVLPRAALVMRLLHEAGPAGLRLSQLVQRTGLPLSLIHISEPTRRS